MRSDKQVLLDRLDKLDYSELINTTDFRLDLEGVLMTVYTVALPNGGTTKTTTAAEVVAELARCGRRVLAVDVDRQGNQIGRAHV